MGTKRMVPVAILGGGETMLKKKKKNHCTFYK